MIINTSQSNIEVVGDVKEFKTSIDPKNLEFITTLLSSNLYSDPEQSFIREIVSNAWDSHVEAGTTNIPVIVRLKDSYDGRSVTIRDFGTGLSPERFKEVYCNIGSSTKRESNEFIGGFGIGKYSSLACSNTVYITSYYKGIAYYYVMVKSGNVITTNLLTEIPTKEKNGVEVTIKNIPSLNPYIKALQYIAFFPNIYIDGPSNACTINDVKLKRFTNFAAASIRISSKLLLGNVLYPLHNYHLEQDVRDFISDISDTGIVIKFDVGEINITPNREDVIYNSDTIKKIEDRVRAAKKELNALINKKLCKDYTDIIKYHSAISKSMRYDPITDTIVQHGGYTFYPKLISDTPITYKGTNLIGMCDSIETILNITLPNFRGVIFRDKIHTKNMPYKVWHSNKIRCPQLIVLNSGAKLVASARSFLKDNYDEYGIMSDISLEDFSSYIKGKLLEPCEHLDFIISGVYDSIMNNAVKINLNNDPAYIKYKDSISINKSSSIKEIKEAILYVYNKQGYKEIRRFNKFSDAVEFIRSLKKGIILTNIDADENLFIHIAQLKGFVYIKARKDIVSAIRKMNLSCIVDNDWLMYKDPMLSKIRTILKYFPNGIDMHDVITLSEDLNKDLQKEFKEIGIINVVYQNYKELAQRETVPYDRFTEYICTKLVDHIKKYREAKRISNTIGYNIHELTTAVVVKTRAYRVSKEAYRKIKNNKLLNVLCGK